jgi:hypothetical protein
MSKLRTTVEEMERKINGLPAMERKIDELSALFDNHFMFAPDGEGAQEAQDDFEKNLEMTTVQVLIQDGKYNRAIDLLLEWKPEDIKAGYINIEELEERWEEAVHLVNTFEPSRICDVYTDVSQRLCRIGRYHAAAKLLKSLC